MQTSLLGMMTHNILPQVLKLALPSWGEMLPPVAGEAADSSTAFREKLQRKAWRSKKFFESASDREDCALLTYIGVGVAPSLNDIVMGSYICISAYIYTRF